MDEFDEEEDIADVPERWVNPSVLAVAIAGVWICSNALFGRSLDIWNSLVGVIFLAVIGAMYLGAVARLRNVERQLGRLNPTACAGNSHDDDIRDEEPWR